MSKCLLIKAGHCPSRCRTVSSSSCHRGQSGSVNTHMIVMCHVPER